MADEKAPAKAAEAAPAAGEKSAHHPKIGRMNLEQINSALDKAQKSMGGLHSSYARFLLARRKVLMESPSKSK